MFATDGLSLAGLLEPCYDNGGDALDYAVNGRTLHVGVFDAMGHGLAAVGTAAFAISAYRNSRRGGRDRLETHAAMEQAVEEQIPDRRFVTPLIAELNLDTGKPQLDQRRPSSATADPPHAPCAHAAHPARHAAGQRPAGQSSDRFPNSPGTGRPAG